jgi:hypothetical protein
MHRRDETNNYGDLEYIFFCTFRPTASYCCNNSGKGGLAFRVSNNFLLVYFDLSSVCKRRLRLSTLKHAKNRALMWLLCISVLGLWTIILCVLMWWVNWIGNEQGCPILVAPMCPLVYITMKQCLYLFLFDRAKVVHNALRIDGLFMRILRWTVYVFSTLGIPALTWWIFILYWRGRVLHEGICVQYTDNIGGVIAVATLDFVLSLAILSLFIAPMIHHIGKIKNDDITPRFRRLIRRNLTVSITMMTSTIASLTVMTVEFTIAHGSSPDPGLEHLQIWGTFFPMLDTILTVILPHVLDHARMTIDVQNLCYRCSRLTDDANGDQPQHFASAPAAGALQKEFRSEALVRPNVSHISPMLRGSRIHQARRFGTHSLQQNQSLRLVSSHFSPPPLGMPEFDEQVDKERTGEQQRVSGTAIDPS